jgi:hypothetical protein
MDAGLLSDVIKNDPIMAHPDCNAFLTEAWEHQALVAAGRTGHLNRYVLLLIVLLILCINS